MKKTNIFSKFKRSKALPLVIIMLVMLILAMVVSSGILKGEPASALFNRGFMAKGNILNLLYGMVIQIFFLCGISCILISGNIDLSVGGQATLCSMVFAWVCKNTSAPWGVALLVALVCAVILGLINTFLVNKLHFPAFIATIGMSSIYSGLCNVMTKGDQIQIARASFIKIGSMKLLGGYLPLEFIIALVVLAIFQFVLSYTRFGRSIFMCGGNMQAARLSGLNPDRTRMILFIVNSIMACLGGLMWAAQNKLASPVAIVQGGMDMAAISAAILGGVAFTGGAGNLVSGFVGILLLRVFNNTLTVINFPTYWTVFASGLVLVVALFIDYVSTERQKKALLIASAAAEAAEFGVIDA